jgi:glycosyltransferase 2 family protein
MQKFLALAAKLAISLGLLYFALARVDLGSLAARLQQIEIGWLLAAFALLGLQAYAIALRWREIVAQCDAALSVARSVRFILIGGFFNQTLPSTVGGDAARVWLLAREGAGWAKATYSVLIDRLIGVLMLAVMVVVCLPWSFDLIRNPVGRAALLVIGVGCIFASAAFVALGYRRWSILERLWLTRHLSQATRFAHRIFASSSVALRLLSLALAVHALTVMTAWLAAKSVAVPFGLLHALLLLPPVMLIASVPISIAGWGVRESAMVLAFSYAGLPPSDGLLLSVLYGGLLFVFGALGGLVWLASPGARRFSPAAASADNSAGRA